MYDYKADLTGILIVEVIHRRKKLLLRSYISFILFIQALCAGEEVNAYSKVPSVSRLCLGYVCDCLSLLYSRQIAIFPV